MTKGSMIEKSKKDNSFSQIIVYFNHNEEVEGVLNFRRKDIGTYFPEKGSRFTCLRVLNGSSRAYLVNYDDLKAILEA